MKKGRTPKGRGPKKGRDLDKWRNNRPHSPEGSIRIIGGEFRGKTLTYSGDKVTRPMKDNVREALFNLVGGYLFDTVAIDLFAGTGAVGLEALSRQAFHSILIERHVPTSKIIRQNVESLDVFDRVTVCCSDTFFWVRQFLQEQQDQRSTLGIDYETLRSKPWAIFCCPPYQLYEDSPEKLISTLESLIGLCPDHSLIVAEFDQRFSPDQLPQSELWKSHQYAPAILSVRKLDSSADESHGSDAEEIAESSDESLT